MAMFEDLNGSGFYANGSSSSSSSSKERIGAVMEDEIEPDVVWEQRVKDVEAERQRRVVTSPGFSFSAAGLLFPYHLGVAKFLIQKGYIKVFYFYLYTNIVEIEQCNKWVLSFYVYFIIFCLFVCYAQLVELANCD